MRAVLDTNVLVSAHAFPGGAPERVYKLALSREFVLVTSPPLVREFSRVLIGKLDRDPSVVADAVLVLSRIADLTAAYGVPSVIAADPDDDVVLATARNGEADVIVTGDRHLLALGSWSSIAIVSVAAFLASWPDRTS